MDVIELIDKLTETSKALLDLCKEQAKIIEMHELLSAGDTHELRDEIEKLKGQVD